MEATIQPSVINFRKLKSRRTYLGLTNARIAQAAGVSGETVSAFLNGNDAVRSEKQDAIAAVLKMRRVVDFQPLESDQGFAESVGQPGLSFSARFEGARGVWVILQQSDFGSHEIAQIPGIDNEKLASFFVRSLSATLK